MTPMPFFRHPQSSSAPRNTAQLLHKLTMYLTVRSYIGCQYPLPHMITITQYALEIKPKPPKKSDRRAKNLPMHPQDLAPQSGTPHLRSACPCQKAASHSSYRYLYGQPPGNYI